MAMRLHSRWIAPRPATIRATGGAAANRDILQIIADVFDAEVVRGATRNSASLGAALRAYHAERRAEGQLIAVGRGRRGIHRAGRGAAHSPEPRERRRLRDAAARVRSVRDARARERHDLKAVTFRR